MLVSENFLWLLTFTSKHIWINNSHFSPSSAFMFKSSSEPLPLKRCNTAVCYLTRTCSAFEKKLIITSPLDLFGEKKKKTHRRENLKQHRTDGLWDFNVKVILKNITSQMAGEFERIREMKGQRLIHSDIFLCQMLPALLCVDYKSPSTFSPQTCSGEIRHQLN